MVIFSFIFKYDYFQEICLKHRWDRTSITTSDKKKLGSNDTERVLPLFQISRPRTAPSLADYCHTQDTSFLWGGGLNSSRGTELKFSKARLNLKKMVLCLLHHANYEKGQTTHDRRKGITKLRKN